MFLLWFALHFLQILMHFLFNVCIRYPYFSFVNFNFSDHCRMVKQFLCTSKFITYCIVFFLSCVTTLFINSKLLPWYLLVLWWNWALSPEKTKSLTAAFARYAWSVESTDVGCDSLLYCALTRRTFTSLDGVFWMFCMLCLMNVLWWNVLHHYSVS